MIEYIYESVNFFAEILFSIYLHILENEFLLYFVLTPIVLVCFIIATDFIFDVRNLFIDFNDFKDNKPFRLSHYKSYYRSKNNKVDMEEVYRKSRNNANYKHS